MIGCVVLVPFAIVYFLAFFGLPFPKGSFFGTWFMGSLTVAGTIATVDFAKTIRPHGWSELGCVLPLAGFTCFWGYIFLKMIGLGD